MKNYSKIGTKFIAAFLLATAISGTAKANLELSANYVYNFSSPSDLNSLDQTIYPGMPALNKLYGYGFDLMYFFPMVHFGGGLRYENITGSVNSGSITQNVYANRWALMAGYRILDNVIFLGGLATYGLSHNFKVSTTNASDLSPAGNQMSYSAGIEGGVKLSSVILGVELGYLSLVGKNLQTTATGPSVDLSGAYTKFRIGYEF